MTGCGKTTIGEKLGHILNKKVIDCDKFIEQNENKKISDMFLISEDFFRQIETKNLEIITKQQNIIISTGGGVVKKNENMELFKDDLIIFINRPVENILSDIDDSNRPIIRGDKEKKEEILNKMYKERLSLYRKYATQEVLNNLSIDETIRKIITIISDYKTN